MVALLTPEFRFPLKIHLNYVNTLFYALKISRKAKCFIEQDPRWRRTNKWEVQSFGVWLICKPSKGLQQREVGGKSFLSRKNTRDIVEFMEKISNILLCLPLACAQGQVVDICTHNTHIHTHKYTIHTET